MGTVTSDQWDLEADSGMSRGEFLDPDNRDLAPTKYEPGENVYAIRWYSPECEWHECSGPAVWLHEYRTCPECGHQW